MCITGVIFILFHQRAAHFWRFCIKAVHHNLTAKRSGVILTPCARFVPISTFLLFSVSEVACGGLDRFQHFWPIFGSFLQILPQLKKRFPEI